MKRTGSGSEPGHRIYSDYHLYHHDHNHWNQHTIHYRLWNIISKWIKTYKTHSGRATENPFNYTAHMCTENMTSWLLTDDKNRIIANACRAVRASDRNINTACWFRVAAHMRSGHILFTLFRRVIIPRAPLWHCAQNPQIDKLPELFFWCCVCCIRSNTFYSLWCMCACVCECV